MCLCVTIGLFSISGSAAPIKNDEYFPDSFPYTKYPYNAQRAVQYAKKFYANRNTYFYDAGMDCTNFVSQCVAYGFGSSPWEQVTNHWNYMRSTKSNLNGPRTVEITEKALGIGDVMQIDFNKDGKYDHTVICISTSPLQFAQHTDNKINPYNKYTGNKRFYRPTSFYEY